MIGTLKTDCRRVHVVGGGFSGLLSAYVLDRAGFEVTLSEASSRLGGLIETVQTEFGPAETAAHSFMVTPPIRALCEDLGVELVGVRPDSTRRWIWRGGRLRRFPFGVLTPMEWLATLARLIVVRAPPLRPNNEMNMEEWSRRHLGDAATRYLLAPFVRGIYGARLSDLCVELAFPSLVISPGHSFLSFFLTKRKKNARPQMMAPRDGMGALIDKLTVRLEQRLGPRLRKNTEIENLDDGGQSTNWVLCVSAAQAAELLARSSQTLHPGALELSHALCRVPYTSLVTTTVFVRQEKRDREQAGMGRGVGVLMPEEEGRQSLGILFNSSAFPGRSREGVESFTVMLGGSCGSLREGIASDLEMILKVPQSRILAMEARRWQSAIPRYGSELDAGLHLARRTWCATPGHVLFGNYTGQVSLRGMIESWSGCVAAGLHFRGLAHDRSSQDTITSKV